MSIPLLRRYTGLESALDILHRKALTLLPPKSWDDKVDRNLMAAFQRRKKLTSALALCFSATGETYHHWRIFTEGKSGVCIVFERERLEQEVAKAGVLVKPMTYKKIVDDSTKPVTTDGLPFTKRYAFRDEKEVRMLYTSATEELRSKAIPVPRGAFEELILSPWMPDSLAETVKSIVKTIPGFSMLEVRKSMLFDSPYWRRVTDA